VRVLLQLRHSADLHTAAVNMAIAAPVIPVIESQIIGFTADYSFSAVQVPSLLPRYTGANRFALAQPTQFSFEPAESTYLVRGQIPDDPIAQAQTLDSAFRDPNVAGVFADPTIESCPICPGDSPRGTAADVASLLSASELAQAGLDGAGVLVAVVDTGINLAHLRAQGRNPTLDAQQSWTPSGVMTTPGQHPVTFPSYCSRPGTVSWPGSRSVNRAACCMRRRRR
jgi:hypothetical protein